jgi:DNA repair protein SbcD/Mre11
MKLLHTSDWHLGKLFHANNLIEDQRHVLSQIVDIVRDERPDAVIVAGDVYDRAMPPADAVKLLDWVLTELVQALETPTVVIAGNHDNPDRLQFGARLLERNGLHVVGRLEAPLRPIPIGAGDDVVHVCPCPFLDPKVAQEHLKDETLTTCEAALRAIADGYRRLLPSGARAVFVAHAFVAGSRASDSERPLSVGGTDEVAAGCFDGFCYTALGHLHTPQTADDPRVRYSGSLLKYSKSEAAMGKSVALVEIDAHGACAVRELPLVPKRDVQEIAGYLAELESGPAPFPNPEDFLYVKLLDTTMPTNAMDRLRRRFPNVVDVNVEAAIAAAVGETAPERSLLRLDDITLFDTFMKEMTGAGLSPEERALLLAAIQAVDQGAGS